MRRDAEDRRDALIAAAHDCFRDSGYLVPLEDIAHRAGVGRGTLYRNFPDRLALAIAVFEREIARLESEVLPDAAPADLVERRMVLAARPYALAFRLADMKREPDARARFAHLEARAIEMWRPLVEGAKEAGVLREDVSIGQVMTLSRIIGGLVTADDDEEVVARTVLPMWRLIVDGLKPRTTGT